MITQKKYKVIGIMTGTSMDGVDCSYIETDGYKFVKIIYEKNYTYKNNYKNKLLKLIKNIKISKKIDLFEIKKQGKFVNDKFLKTIIKFINEYQINKKEISYIGLSGQTVYHNPKKKISIQLGDPETLCKKLKINIVSDFRDNDLQNNGQGAPIASFYHKYLIEKLKLKNSLIINLGGIANITYLDNKKLIAFDVGPANCLIDDFMLSKFKKKFDKNGRFSTKGLANMTILKNILDDNFFKKPYPKSLDRMYFAKYLKKIEKLKNEDAAATLSFLTVLGIKKGLKTLNKKIDKIILTGGGRKNMFFFNNLNNFINIKTELIDKYGFNGDFLESQAFGYISIRSVKKLPLSSPTTTGVNINLTGGKIYNY